MSTHKSIERVCCAVLVVVLLVTLLFCNAERLGVKRASTVMGYETRLFDTSRVHTIEIIMDDWEGFLEECENEEYQPCSLVIDNEAYKNVALRAKGNTSLSMVKSYGNNRYSFKIEFDHYDSGKSYYGLDKLCLNNIIQDNTYMKDYLAYTLMREGGVPSPLCSYVYITVNGEEWGLYLAVEDIEDGFLTRNYGREYGELYKPDSMKGGGGGGEPPGGFPGGGNMPEGFPDMGNMPQGFSDTDKEETPGDSSALENMSVTLPDSQNTPPDTGGTQTPQGEPPEGNQPPQGEPPEGNPPPQGELLEQNQPPQGEPPEGTQPPQGEPPEGTQPPQGEPSERNPPPQGEPSERNRPPQGEPLEQNQPPQGEPPEGTQPPQGEPPEGTQPPQGEPSEGTQPPQDEQFNGSQPPQQEPDENAASTGGEDIRGGRRHEGGFGGMGSDDTKLKYIDDDPESYANIFDNVKTDITDADKTRLIDSLRKLNANEQIESVVDTEEVMRYLVVHNFLCNGDSYTGSMVHNYYLYEKDGQLSMLPWDYNLSFGGFGMGGFGSSGGGATDTVNSPIDSPVSGDISDRPMVAWIFEDEAYIEQYHQYYAELLRRAQGDGGIADTIVKTAELITTYVERDPTKFCTLAEFQTGIRTLRDFCELRLESISGQLDGTIPSTSEGQQGSTALVDASEIELSDMGSMNHGGGPGDRQNGGTPTAPRGDSQNGGAPTVPGGDDQNGGAPAALGGDSQNGGAPAALGGDSRNGGAPAVPGGDDQNGGVPTAPGGDSQNGGAPTLPGGDSQNGGAPTVPGGDDQNGGAPTVPGGDSQNGGAPTPPGNDSQNGGGQNGSRPGGANPFEERGNADSGPQNGGILLAISAAVLLAGLLFAFKFRR